MLRPVLSACLASTQRQPFVVSVLLIITSILMALSLNYHLGMVWIPAIIILTYSSGMIIIIMYVSSLIPTFYLKPNMKPILLVVTSLFAMKSNKVREIHRLKEAYNNTFVNLIGVVILLALFTLSILAFEPQKPMQNSNYENKIEK